MGATQSRGQSIPRTAQSCPSSAQIGKAGESAIRCRIGVNERAGQLGHRTGQRVLRLVSDPVSLIEGGHRVDVEFGVGVQAVPDPSHLHAAHRRHSRFGGERRLGAVDQGRVDGVH